MTSAYTKERFREVRQSSGMSYADFAKSIGISKSSVSRYENGELPIPRKIELALEAMTSQIQGGR